MNRTIRLASLAASLILLAGCEKTAEGQVAAVVNGEEITLREVDMEMEMQKVSKGIAESTARQAALQRIVQRRLLAQAARSDGIDQSPDYLIRRRVLDDSLLIQLLAKKIDATIKVPQPSAIDALIKERPAMFANRTMMTIDRIQFAGNESVLKQLEDAHSIDAVVEVLNANKIEFTRGS